MSVSALPTSGGSVSATSYQAEAGKAVTVYAFTSQNYKFSYWRNEQGDTVAKTTSYNFTMPRRNVALQAVFIYSPGNPAEPVAPGKRVPVTVTVTPTAAGRVEGAGSFEVGSTISLTAYTNDGYTFKNWTKGSTEIGTDSNLEYTVVANGNQLQANYIYSPENPEEPARPDKIYTLTLKGANPGIDSFSIVSGIRYSAGEEVTIEAIPTEGYKVGRWVDDAGIVVGSGSTVVYTMPARSATINVSAEYSPINPDEPSPSAPRRNVLYGSRENVIPGTPLIYSVCLENADNVSGFNVDMSVPEGFDFRVGEASLSSRSNGHTITAERLSGSSWRIMVRGASRLEGGNGPVVRIPVSTPASGVIGSSVAVGMSKGVVFYEDGTQDAVNASDGHIRFIAGEGTEPDSPDFVVTNLTSESGAVMPGDEVTLSWSVANQGNIPATGGWTESVFLVDDSGRRATLGTLHYDTESFAVGRTESRSATLRIAALPGISGELHPGVTVIPNALSGELQLKQENNTLIAEGATVTLGKRLVLELPDSIAEGKDTFTRGRLSRSGSWSEAQTFRLEELTGDTRIRLPESVTIPRNQSAAEFMLELTDDDIAEGKRTARVRVSGNEYDAVEKTVGIVDNDFNSLELTTPADELMEGETIQATVSIPVALARDLVVSISTDSPSRVKIPSSVTIAKGSKEATFGIEAIQNEKVEGETGVVIKVKAEEFISAETVIAIEDDDLPALSLELVPDQVSEGAGYNAVRAFLRRSSNMDKKITVDLTDDAPGALYYAVRRVVMEPGVKEAEISIGVNDNNIVDGDRKVAISAAVYLSACRCSATGKQAGTASDTLTIIDNDGPSLTLRASSSTLMEGDTWGIQLTVERNTDTKDPLTVSLSCDADDPVVVFDRSVVIPAGARSASVKVVAPANDKTNDGRTLVFSATASDYARGTCWVMLSDRTLPDASVSSVTVTPMNPVAGDEVTVKVGVLNSGVQTLPAAYPVSFYVRGANVGMAVVGTDVAAGDSVMVTKKLRMPEVPGEAALTVRLNEKREYPEQLYTNNGYRDLLLTLGSPYAIELSSAKALYGTGERIELQGKVSGRYESGDSIDVYLLNAGAREVFRTEIGADGSFALTHTPYHGQVGRYEAGACFPGQVTSEGMTSFDVIGISNVAPAYHQLLSGIPFRTEIELENTCSVPLTGLTAKAGTMPEGITVTATVPAAIAPGEKGVMQVELLADKKSQEKKWYPYSIVVEGANGLAMDLRNFCYAQHPYGVIEATERSVTATFPVDKVTEFPVHIVNTGKGATGAITLSMPGRIRPTGAMVLPSLNPGEATDIMLRLAFTEGMNLNYPISGEMGISCENGEGTSVKYVFTPVSEEEGDLMVRVCDEYTYNTKEAPLVSGATVRLSNPSTGAEICKGVSSHSGLYTTTLPAGYYRLDVSAPKHEPCSKVIFLNPGKENVVTANISYNPIEIKWEVKETEIEDEYSIRTVVKYESDVPMPVVKVDMPEKIDGDNMAVGEATIINMTLTNIGLISADNVRLIMPGNTTEWKFEPLAYQEPFRLDAHKSVTVPVRITRLPDPTEMVPSAGKRTFATDTYETYANCMNYLGAYYDVLCGVELRTTQTQRIMAMKLCSLMAPLGAIANLIPGGPGSPWDYNGGGIQGKEYLGTPEADFDICDECDAQRANNAINHLAGKTPLSGLNGVLNTATEGYVDQGMKAHYARNYIKSLAEAKLRGWANKNAYGDWNDLVGLANDIKKIKAPCKIKGTGVGSGTDDDDDDDGDDDGDDDDDYNPYNPDNGYPPSDPSNGPSPKPASASSKTVGTVSSDRSWMVSFDKAADDYIDQLLRMDAILRYTYGDRVWYTYMDEEKARFLSYVETLKDGIVPDEEAIREVLPSSVTYDQALALIRHHFNMDPNPIPDEVFCEFLDTFEAADRLAREEGYEHSTDRFWTKYEQYLKDIDGLKSGGVCASVSLGIDQTLAMTRQAFRGTLGVYNGHDSKPMKDLKLNLIITGEDGMTATSHEFQISAESLKGFDGNLSLEEGWQLASGEKGEATILFIPTRFAAPDRDVVYTFSGSVSYIDPFSDLEITRSLFPVSVTVRPAPSLELTYFMQRDVYGDDPHTEDVVEPSVPAEFALVIANRGAGKASNLRLLTEQPKILENEKGLLVDFNLESSQLNGSDKVLSFGGSIASDFGDIEPGESSYAQWWLTSSLLGHFVDYDVEATHVTSYGNPDLSLLEKVEIHELIRGISVDWKAKAAPVRGFLADDIADRLDMPDHIYYSDGREPEVVNGAIGVEHHQTAPLEYEVKVTAPSEGWTYGRVPDPTGGRNRIVSVTRKSDGMPISADNFWQTSITMADGKKPVHERMLHLAAQVKDTETFIVRFEERPESVLEVKDFVGFTGNDSVVGTQVEHVDVEFNKAIIPSTFTSEDIRLSLRGVNLDTEKVTVTPLSDTKYRIGLGDLTLSNGYYVLTVATSGILDAEGFEGETGASLSWLYFPDGKVTLTIEKTPLEGGEVNRVSERVPYGSYINLEAVPATGYNFTAWHRNGEFHTSDRSFSHVMNDDEVFTAHFEKDATVGLDETGAGGFSVTPLPMGDEITVGGDFGIATELTLIDMKGAVVARWTDIVPGMTLRLPELPAGIYMLRAETPGGTYLQKALKR